MYPLGTPMLDARNSLRDFFVVELGARNDVRRLIDADCICVGSCLFQDLLAEHDDRLPKILYDLGGMAASW